MNVPALHPLVKLLRWCRANVPDGRLSMCRVETIGGACQPCAKVCGDCRAVEKRAVNLEHAGAVEALKGTT